MLTQNGTIIKGIGGFYYVKTDIGIIECRARGKFRNEAKVPTVGDFVDIDIDENGSGTVKKIGKRKNFFVRPPISNIDTLVLVAAVKNPNPDLLFIDKMLIIAKNNNVDAVLCINKSDLCDSADAEKICKIYENADVKTIVTSTLSNVGIDELKGLINKKVTAFAGFSGVGKSSILKKLTGLDLQTGSISKKLSRGKHTTRCVELLEYADGSYLADTPGFSMLDLPKIAPEELWQYYPEFLSFADGCRFSDCRHLNERDCGIKNAVENGEIPPSRYESYRVFYEYLKQKENEYK